ncbi:hypothetical protein [Lysobacter gummosus]|uniref:hypothetical protein n=1 Tax=Lysobacter gummosus TaxID=262324 RepID=UPI00363A6679
MTTTLPRPHRLGLLLSALFAAGLLSACNKPADAPPDAGAGPAPAAPADTTPPPADTTPRRTCRRRPIRRPPTPRRPTRCRPTAPPRRRTRARPRRRRSSKPARRSHRNGPLARPVLSALAGRVTARAGERTRTPPVALHGRGQARRKPNICRSAARIAAAHETTRSRHACLRPVANRAPPTATEIVKRPSGRFRRVTVLC